MGLQMCSLNSGSNGNCYYIGNEQHAVLVDAGLSCRETERRMMASGLNMQKVNAIVISHEHSDHIRGVERIAKRYQLPVYITAQTLQHSRLKLPDHLVKPFSHAEGFSVESINITPFRKHHDAVDPHSFILEYNLTTVGVLTDIGHGCDMVTNYLSRCHALFLESNYDEQMLHEGNYPYHLKKRISGGMGHLSNAQALQLVEQHAAPFLQHLYLSHLSRENNHPQRALNTFSTLSRNINVNIAGRYEPTPVQYISANAPSHTNSETPKTQSVQLKLF